MSEIQRSILRLVVLWVIISILAICASGQASELTVGERNSQVCNNPANVLSVLCTGVGGETNGKSLIDNMKADHKALYNDWKYLKDSVLYDVEEYWTIAKWRRGRIAGDCEDAALYMMNKALSHYSNSSIDDRVFIIGVNTKVNGTRANHAIYAIILIDDTWLVSDNRHPRGVRAMKQLKDEYNVISSVTLNALRR